MSYFTRQSFDVDALIKTLCTVPWPVEDERLEVRYDNGQLCTFRLKSEQST